MGYTCFDVTESDHVAHVQLNRPDKLNSMIPEFWTELPEIVKAISAKGQARAIVLSSTGKHFSAGHDLRAKSKDTAGIDFPPIGTWGGFVFINPDPNAEPFDSYCGELTQHFERASTRHKRQRIKSIFQRPRWNMTMKPKS